MQLIPIKCLTIGNTNCNGASARDVHTQLEVKKKFSDWIKGQIKTLDLIENVDFVAVPLKGTGGKFDSIEYYITIDTAKHIAMASRTAKGREVRNYFISIEKDFLVQLDKQLAVKQAVIDTQKRLLDQFATNTTQKLPKSLEWSGKPWTDRDDSELISLELSRWDYKRIAQKLKRTESEVSQRASQIKEALSVV
jgi:phage anti-repressor protein